MKREEREENIKKRWERRKLKVLWYCYLIEKLLFKWIDNGREGMCHFSNLKDCVCTNSKPQMSK